MPFKKRQSKVIMEALQQRTGLTSISPNLSLGTSMSMEVYNVQLEQLQQALDAYNKALSEADVAANALDAAEKNMMELMNRMRSTIKGIYGPDSDAYELAGGTRVSERKRAVRKAAAD